MDKRALSQIFKKEFHAGILSWASSLPFNNFNQERHCLFAAHFLAKYWPQYFQRYLKGNNNKMAETWFAHSNLYEAKFYVENPIFILKFWETQNKDFAQQK